MLFYGSANEPWKGPSVVSYLKFLAAQEVAEVDDEALATAMAANGIGSATPAQVKAAMQQVLALADRADGPRGRTDGPRARPDGPRAE
jgi:mannose/fructose/N-acetylgalactosamine-specific phosphotransferase system component IIB